MVAMTAIFVSEGRNAIQYVTGVAALLFAIASAVRLFARATPRPAGEPVE